MIQLTSNCGVSKWVDIKFLLFKMIIVAAKLIGSGLASIGVIGAGIGIGTIFGCYLLALSRNPLLKGELFSIMLLGFALVEATALFSLMLAFLILFAF